MAHPHNAYPNPDNFHELSFPQEVIAPLFDADVDTICVRYSKHWTQVLMAACSQLTQLASWKGTDDEKKLAVSRATNLKILLQQAEDCDMGCCYDVVTRRITSDGEMQISVNGGDWQPDPDDPRIGATLYPPPTFDDHHTKCDAATNVAEHLNDVITETSDQLGGAGSLVEIAAAIALAIFALFLAPESIPALVPVILPLISAVLFLGQAAFDAYFTSDVHDAILCAIFCAIGDDGTFTDAQYSDLLSRLGSALPASPAKDYFIQIVGRIGLVGMNDYAAVGTSADADCSDCTCGDNCFETWASLDQGSGAPTRTTGTDIYGDYIQWDSRLTGASDQRVLITNDGHYPSESVSDGCCDMVTAQTRIWAVDGSVEISIGTLGGFLCGDPDLGHFVGSLPNSFWGWTAINPGGSPFSMRVYAGGT